MKRRIAVTLHVRVDLPTNANAAEIMIAVRTKIHSWLSDKYKITMQAELEDRVTVKLVKKEISYD